MASFLIEAMASFVIVPRLSIRPPPAFSIVPPWLWIVPSFVSVATGNGGTASGEPTVIVPWLLTVAPLSFLSAPFAALTSPVLFSVPLLSSVPVLVITAWFTSRPELENIPALTIWLPVPFVSVPPLSIEPPLWIVAAKVTSVPPLSMLAPAALSSVPPWLNEPLLENFPLFVSWLDASVVNAALLSILPPTLLVKTAAPCNVAVPPEFVNVPLLSNVPLASNVPLFVNEAPAAFAKLPTRLKVPALLTVALLAKVLPASAFTVSRFWNVPLLSIEAPLSLVIVPLTLLKRPAVVRLPW